MQPSIILQQISDARPVQVDHAGLSKWVLKTRFLKVFKLKNIKNSEF